MYALIDATLEGICGTCTPMAERLSYINIQRRRSAMDRSDLVKIARGYTQTNRFACVRVGFI